MIFLDPVKNDNTKAISAIITQNFVSDAGYGRMLENNSL
jgi:hypothetical protein